ncbi:hypothetical protein [Roseivirga pacifica]
MKKLLALLSLIIIVQACTPPQKEEDKKAAPIVEEPERQPRMMVHGDLPDHQFQFSSLRLNEHISNIDLSAFKHYGEFYTDDFTIYRLDRLDYLAESYFINDINLYFIDSLLVKIQAYLIEDKSSEFLGRYGKAKIFVSNYRNKKLLENEEVLVTQNGKKRINENLDYYRLKWIREDLDIEYLVNKQADSPSNKEAMLFDDSRQQYKLTFQTKDFDHQMAWVKWESYKESRGLVAKPASELSQE